MGKILCFLGHSSRVLNMALSPDGTTVVSTAGDETLRLWNCFQKDPKLKKVTQSKVQTGPFTKGIR